jgi:uncharacterized protein
MTFEYHPGALAVQTRAGVAEAARRVGKGIRADLPPAFAAFLAEQPLALVASTGHDGQVWASALAGQPGFLRALDARTLHIAARPAPGDPLATNLADDAALGLLVIDLATRRRVRVNGTLRGWTDDGFVVETEEVFGNCQQYIQRRSIVAATPATASAAPGRTATLTPGQRSLIATADTFFIASAHPSGGADASHRGGNPGFVRVIDERTLLFPDYAGNTMFQTLGNLAANPRCGLLFIDFARGTTLQLSGTAELLWDPAQYATFAGAERAVEVRVAEVIERPGALPLRWQLRGYSPFNPAASE